MFMWGLLVLECAQEYDLCTRAKYPETRWWRNEQAIFYCFDFPTGIWHDQ
jgi:hypothetical protein